MADPKKQFEVGDEVRERTTKCPHHFKCLAPGGSPGCPFGGTCVGEHIFVDLDKKDLGCPYALSFGHSHICRCPTRCEIYQKYKK